MPPSAPLPEEIPILLLSALGSGLVLVVLIRNTRRLLALLAREGSRSLEDLRWLEDAIQLLSRLPPGSRAELKCANGTCASRSRGTSSPPARMRTSSHSTGPGGPLATMPRRGRLRWRVRQE